MNEHLSVITNCLFTDTTKFGAVWRESRHTGRNFEELRQRVAPLQPVSYIRKYLAFLDALIDGDTSGIGGHEREAGTQLHRFVARHSQALPTDVAEAIRARANAIWDTLNDPAVVEAARQRVITIERTAVPGIYVYALPHYLLHPVEPAIDDVDADRTLFKIGMSDSDAIRRFHQQRRSTELPEDPELLRIYVGGAKPYLELERDIHMLLRAADHRQARGDRVGTEWFLTSLKFLDALAVQMSLAQHDAQF